MLPSYVNAFGNAVTLHIGSPYANTTTVFSGNGVEIDQGSLSVKQFVDASGDITGRADLNIEADSYLENNVYVGGAKDSTPFIGAWGTQVTFNGVDGDWLVHTGDTALGLGCNSNHYRSGNYYHYCGNVNFNSEAGNAFFHNHVDIGNNLLASGNTQFGSSVSNTHKLSGDTTIVGDLALNVAGATAKRSITSTASTTQRSSGATSTR